MGKGITNAIGVIILVVLLSFGSAFGKLYGGYILVPGICLMFSNFIIKRLIKNRNKYYINAIVIQGSHVLWMISGLILGYFMNYITNYAAIIECMIIVTGLLFIYFKPLSVAPIAVLSLYQTLAIGINIYSMFAEQVNSPMIVALLVHISLRSLGVLFMVLGYKTERQYHDKSIKKIDTMEEDNKELKQSNALEVENRLKVLNDLKTNGAITESEYDEKRKQIISNI